LFIELPDCNLKGENEDDKERKIARMIKRREIGEKMEFW